MVCVTGPLLYGAAAGAAGTTALNVVSYGDMVVRGRPASSTPETIVPHLAYAVVTVSVFNRLLGGAPAPS